MRAARVAPDSRMDPTSKLQSCLASFDAGATPEAVYALAYLLSHVVGEDEAPLLSSLREAPRAIPQAIALARSRAAEGDTTAMKDVLSALANLACIGGVDLVKQQAHPQPDPYPHPNLVKALALCTPCPSRLPSPWP